MKNSNDIIGNRSRDLPVCSAVPQPLRHRMPRPNSSTRRKSNVTNQTIFPAVTLRADHFICFQWGAKEVSCILWRIALDISTLCLLTYSSAAPTDYVNKPTALITREVYLRHRLF
jgi:hypothetical protein